MKCKACIFALLCTMAVGLVMLALLLTPYIPQIFSGLCAVGGAVAVFTYFYNQFSILK